MKKLAFLLSVFAFSYTFAQAPLERGSSQLNAGVGTSGWGVPIYVGLDYGLADNFTIGGELSYQSYNQKYASSEANSSIFGIQANGNYHFNELLSMRSEWDFYAGASLNYFSWSTTYNGAKFDNNNNNNLNLGIQVGGRYFFNDKFAVNLQVGGGTVVGGVKLGITYKL
jgi:outer membrane protein W